jgi:hypothetical protein
LCNEALKAELEVKNLLDDIVKFPEPYKKDFKWRTWKESTLT